MEILWEWRVATPTEISQFNAAILRVQAVLVGDFFSLIFLTKIKQMMLFLRKVSFKIFQVFFSLRGQSSHKLIQPTSTNKPKKATKPHNQREASIFP